VSPEILKPSNGQFIGSNRTTVSGSKAADQKIHLLSPLGDDPLCIIEDMSTAWTCTNITLPNGPRVLLRVVVIDDSSLTGDITVAVLGAPTVLGGLTGSESNGWVRGTGHPQAAVTAALPSGETCSGTADNSGAWACLFEGSQTNGSHLVTASQRSAFSEPSSSNLSASVSIVFDRVAPKAPVVTTPRNAAQVPLAGTSYAGTGEPGATVTVFAGPYSVCSAPVSDKTWNCTAGGVAAGSYPVIAVQKDSAGNVSAGSAPITVNYVSKEASNTPSPTESAPAAPPVTQSPSQAPSSTPNEWASSTPDAAIVPPMKPSQTVVPSRTSGPATSTPKPSATKPDKSETETPAVSALPGEWNDPTAFALALTKSETSTPFPWLQAVSLALGALLLVMIPLRMLAGAISRRRGSRPPWHFPSLVGRNRAREEFDVAPTLPLNRWLRSGAGLVAAATFIMLSGPVVDQPAYVRLLIAVVLGLVLINAVGLLVPLWWSSRILRLQGSVRFLPRYLLIVAAAAIASRIFDVHPAVLFGVLGTVTLSAKADAPGQVATHPTIAQHGQLAAVRVGSLMTLAVVAWTFRSFLPLATDFTTSLVAETANTVVLASIGSAVLILLPIGHTSGRSVLAWSPVVWIGLTLSAYGILFGALAPVIEQLHTSGMGMPLWIAAGCFAALCASLWAWQRYIAPTQR
jgi:hypothetical protein